MLFSGGGGVRVGRLAGIPIILDVTFFISFGLIVLILGTDVLPRLIDPDPSRLTAWSLAVVGGVIFFGSLLLHELAHSLVARGYGMPVHSITLFLLGGVSQIAQESTKPSQEFLVAVVGPLTSALLGAAFLGLYALLGAPDAAWAAILWWLGLINLLLAAFNMIPGFPMDGGRVFRSLLWALSGSRTLATRWAARVGMGVGGAMALFGVISLLPSSLLGIGFDGIGGLWLIMIGAFLFNAAQQALRGLTVERELTRVRVRDVMTTEMRTVDAATPARALLQRAELSEGSRALMVVRHDVVVGMVTGHILSALPGAKIDALTAGEVMVSADSLQPIAPAASGSEALSRLQAEEVGVLPVVEDGRLLGLIGLDQVARALKRRPPLAGEAG